MRGLSICICVSLVLSGGAGAVAASSNIGLATASGSFHVNSSTVWNNATLLDGSTVETLQAASQLTLNNGTRVRLAAESRARVFQERMVLENGSGQIESAAGYPIEARTLLVYAASPDSVARVQLMEGNQVSVATVKGAARVTNAAGVLVAKMEAGDALSFTPQEAGATGPTRLAGCLYVAEDGKLIIVDQTSNVTVVVRGEGLKEQLGHPIEITGASDEAQVVTISELKRLPGTCPAQATLRPASALSRPVPASAPKTAGGVSGKTIAIIGGIAVAGTVGGLAGAGAFSSSQSQPSTSR
jgi:hypothetical protein